MADKKDEIRSPFERKRTIIGGTIPEPKVIEEKQTQVTFTPLESHTPIVSNDPINNKKLLNRTTIQKSIYYTPENYKKIEALRKVLFKEDDIEINLSQMINILIEKCKKEDFQAK